MSSPTDPAKDGRGWAPLGCMGLLGGVLLALRWPLAGIALGLLSIALIWYGSLRVAAMAKVRDEKWQALGAPVGAIWRRLLEAEGLGDLVEVVAPYVRPAVRVSTERVERVDRGASRIGGLPDLAPGVTWPRGKDKPMAFLAQLDLEAVARVLPDSTLPRTGHLWFFYDVSRWSTGGRPKDADDWAVLYQDAGAPFEPAVAPSDLPERARFPLCRVTLERFEDLPEPEDVPSLEETFDEDELRQDTYFRVRDYLTAGPSGDSHKLLGFANSIQDRMEEGCQLVTNGLTYAEARKQEPSAAELKAGAKDWRLLLQVESDDRAGMMWGDAGRLYFWIREQDLRAARFEKVWMMYQCY